MTAPYLERFRCKFKACPQIITFQIRKLRENFLKRISRRKILQNGLHWITQATNNGFAVANLRVDCDAFQQ